MDKRKGVALLQLWLFVKPSFLIFKFWKGLFLGIAQQQRKGRLRDACVFMCLKRSSYPLIFQAIMVKKKRDWKRERKRKTHTHTNYIHTRQRKDEGIQATRQRVLDRVLEHCARRKRRGKKRRCSLSFVVVTLWMPANCGKGEKNRRALSIFICFQFFVCFSYLCPGFVGRDSQVRMLLFLPRWQYLESSTMKRMNMMKRGKRKKWRGKEGGCRWMPTIGTGKNHMRKVKIGVHAVLFNISGLLSSLFHASLIVPIE